MSITKPFEISKRLIFEAWKRVKLNRGSYGVDLQSIQDFEEKIGDNLYKLWNRMSSGSYFPPSVRQVEIPKSSGGKRALGIPTVADRIAQTAVTMVLEPEIDPIFHPDSYGFRPGRSAIDAVSITRQRCWQYDWVIDLDIKGFFDNIDHGLMMKAVRKHTKTKWIQLYVERWLKAPVQLQDGALRIREKGTPQGGVVSPLLANLFLHYAFDYWMKRNYPYIHFARYADDIIVHCRTEIEAENMIGVIKERLKQCDLEIHPEKTRIAYCKDSNRKLKKPLVNFDFLGFTFRPRKVVTKKGQTFTGFNPAIAEKAKKRISKTIRSWKLQRWSAHSIEDIAKALNPVIRGWINYYGNFYKSELARIAKILDFALIRWARKKFRKLKRSYRRSRKYLHRVRRQNPCLFSHWRMLRY